MPAPAAVPHTGVLRVLVKVPPVPACCTYWIDAVLRQLHRYDHMAFVRLIARLALLGCTGHATGCWRCVLRAIRLALPEGPRAGMVLPARGLASRAAACLASAADERARLIRMRGAEALARAERRGVWEWGHARDLACTAATRLASATHEFEGLRSVQPAEAWHRTGHQLRPQPRRARLELEREPDAAAPEGRSRQIERVAVHATASAGLGEALALCAKKS